MKVGDLVSVKQTHGRKPVMGLVLELYVDDEGIDLGSGHALVQPCDSDSNRLMWANPLDVEVINESR